MFKLTNPCPTPKKAAMNVFKIVRRMGLSVAALSMFGFVSFSAFAITQEEYEADNSLIPTPSASSPFYVTGAGSIEPVGEQVVSANMQGIDATPAVRDYSFQFLTDLTSYKVGFILFYR